MPSGVLYFNLNDPEDKQAYKRAIKADDMQIAIDTWYQEIFRNRIKYGEMSQEVREVIQNLVRELNKHFEGLTEVV